MMYGTLRFRAMFLFTVAGAVLLFLCTLALCYFDAILGSDPIVGAWRRAQASPSYQFSADIVQVTTPSVSAANVGRTSREERTHLTGRSDRQARLLELQLWPQGKGALEVGGALTVRIANGKTMVRDGDGTWQEVGDVADVFAPQGDILAYLKAVRDIKPHPPERRAGIVFTRYSFSLDGPAFARYARDQLEQALQQRGELPPGVRLELAAAYVQMQGSGELWVDERGLPLRQTLRLSFPEQNGEQLSSLITVDFKDFAAPQGRVVAALDAAAIAARLSQLAAVALVLVFGAAIVTFRQSRALRCGLTGVLLVALVVGPLLGDIRRAAFAEDQRTRVAEAAQLRSEQSALAALQADQLTGRFDPHAPQVPNTTGSPEAGVPPLTAPSTLAVDSKTDTDKDGLNDFVETSLGTDPTNVDSDGDTLTDHTVGKLGARMTGCPTPITPTPMP